MPLSHAISNINSLRSFDVAKEIEIIINRNSEQIVTLLKNQLQQGKDSNNDNVTIFGRDYYADATVFEKERHGVGLGSFTQWITNYMSGAFYNSLSVVVKGSVFDVVSDVDYFPEITSRSGDKIMELNQENLQRFYEEILIPQLMVSFQQQTNV